MKDRRRENPSIGLCNVSLVSAILVPIGEVRRTEKSENAGIPAEMLSLVLITERCTFAPQVLNAR
jgi:hypothetical protein